MKKERFVNKKTADNTENRVKNPKKSKIIDSVNVDRTRKRTGATLGTLIVSGAVNAAPKGAPAPVPVSHRHDAGTAPLERYPCD